MTFNQWWYCFFLPYSKNCQLFSQKIVLDNLENNFDLHLTFIYLTVIKSRQNVKENTKNKYLNVLLLFSQKKNFEASRRGNEAFYNFFPTSYDH